MDLDTLRELQFQEDRDAAPLNNESVLRDMEYDDSISIRSHPLDW